MNSRPLSVGALGETEPGLPLVLADDGKPIERSYFWTEGCAVFALLLAQRLRQRGCDADIAVVSRVDGEPWSHDWEFEFTHGVVSVPDGYIDANGFAPDAFTLARRIGMASYPNDVRIEGEWEPALFKTTFTGTGDDKPLYGEAEWAVDWAHRLLDATPQVYRLG